MLDRGIYRMEDYVEGGWVTALKYEDELIKDLEKRTGSDSDKLKSVRFHGANSHASRCHSKKNCTGRYALADMRTSTDWAFSHFGHST